MSTVAQEIDASAAGGKKTRVLAAGFIGNILEWYDFAVYGFFAPTIGKLFFPAADARTSLIAAFGAFAAGFLMRPFGAVLFGHIGDRIGRKKALTLSVMMMAVPTMLVGLLPTHAEIGITAAVLMILLRMVQGVSVGGEYTSSFVFLVEHAPPHRRAFFGAWSMIGATCGILLGSAVGALINSFTTDIQLQNWGWRFRSSPACWSRSSVISFGTAFPINPSLKNCQNRNPARPSRRPGPAIARRCCSQPA